MHDVTPRFKAEPIECPCSCGAVGQPRVKAWSNGDRCNRNCKGCRHCRGLRSRSGGKRSQAKGSTLLGMPRSTLKPGHEELAGGTVRWEHKSGKQASPVITKFRASEAQSEALKAVGDHRPFVATFGHDGRMLAVFDLADGPQVVAALAEQYGMTP